MSDQPNLDSEQQAIADRLREEEAVEQQARLERADAKSASDSETILHLRAIRAVLEYFGELALTDFADKEFAATEAVRRSREPIVTEDGQVNRDVMVAAVDLVVTEMPYLVKPLRLGVPDAPLGPSGAACGSGRRYRPTARDYATLRRLYPAAYPND